MTNKRDPEREESCEDRDFLCCDYFPPPKPVSEMTHGEYCAWYPRHVYEYNRLRLSDPPETWD